MNKNKELECLQKFLLTLGYEWSYVYLKISDETFKVAKSFSDVKCEKGEVVFLELCKEKKMLYLKFRITEEKFQKIMSCSVYFVNGVEEDFSKEWKSFLCENHNYEI